jgi:long-chain acyl-CoA synthetase
MGFVNFCPGSAKTQTSRPPVTPNVPAAVHRRHPWVENAMVYGDGRPHIICMIVPDFASLGTYARENRLPEDPAQLVVDTAVQKMIANEITAFLKGNFGGYEIPKEFELIQEDFSLEKGTLTQTMNMH